MYAHIYGNLKRQYLGFQLLDSLLNEEFADLIDRRLDDVATLEFSIHELMRQLFVERRKLGKSMNGIRVSQYAQMLPDAERAAILALIADLDHIEQKCARQSSMNAELVFGLLDQGQQMLDFIHKRILPPKERQYGRRGAFVDARPEAAVITGRL